MNVYILMQVREDICIYTYIYIYTYTECIYRICRFVWDVDGVAEITWPAGVRNVNVMLQEVCALFLSSFFFFFLFFYLQPLKM